MVIKHTGITAIPATFKEADADMSRLHAIEQTIVEIEAGLAAEIARLREQARAKSAPLKKARVDIRKRLGLYGKQNRRTIVTRYGKSMRLTHGVIEFRYAPPSVIVKKIGDKRAIARLEKQGLGRYVRIEKTINRELLLEERPYIPWITYRQPERCRVCPDPVITAKPA